MKTKAQIISRTFDERLPRRKRPYTLAKMREIRLHPTVSMARRLVRAAIISTPWSIESADDAPDEAKDFLDETLQPWRSTILRAATAAMVDYGWQPFEVVLEEADGRAGVGKVKPLLQELTEILIDKDTGEFVGLRQLDDNANEIDLGRMNSLLISFDVEGTDWYGQARLESVHGSHEAWKNIAATNDRYDRKVAGTHWVIHYPVGSSPYNGQEVDNYDVAMDILAKLEASGATVIPTTLEAWLNQVNENSVRAWRIELMSDSQQVQTQFVERMKYLDAMMVRGVGLPERAVLEGQFGTKAEAAAHADFAITDIEQTHEVICEQVNAQLSDTLLRLNWGPDTVRSVYVTPSPLSEARRVVLREVYLKMLGSPEIMATEAVKIDTDAFRDALGLPYRSEGEQDDERAALLLRRATPAEPDEMTEDGEAA